MSAEPFAREEGWKYFQDQSKVKILDECFTGIGWVQINGEINPWSFSCDCWFRRRLPNANPQAPQQGSRMENAGSGWVKFSDALPEDGQAVHFGRAGMYDETPKRYTRSGSPPKDFTHWHPASLPEEYPPQEPTREEREMQAWRDWAKPLGEDRAGSITIEAFLAGVRHGRENEMKLPPTNWIDIAVWAADNNWDTKQAIDEALGHAEIEFSPKGDGGFVRYSSMPIIKGKLKKVSKSDQQRDSIWPDGMEPPPFRK